MSSQRQRKRASTAVERKVLYETTKTNTYFCNINLSIWMRTSPTRQKTGIHKSSQLGGDKINSVRKAWPGTRSTGFRPHRLILLHMMTSGFDVRRKTWNESAGQHQTGDKSAKKRQQAQGQR